MDLGQLDKCIELLNRCLQVAPQHSHLRGPGQKGDLAQAKAFTNRALVAEPENPVALNNLGAILGREGDSLRALSFLRQSYQINPKDPQTMYGLAFAYMEMGDIEPAQKNFQVVLDMPAPEELRALARNGLREIAVRELKARGPRMNAGSIDWISITTKRSMSCSRCRGGTFPLWSCCASCKVALRS